MRNTHENKYENIKYYLILLKLIIKQLLNSIPKSTKKFKYECNEINQKQII